ncbi:MAG: YjbH domain-containing protein, partial [Quisquiliibacterium sp.]
MRLALMVLVGLASLPSQAGSAELGQGLWPAFTAGAPPPPSTSYAATTGLLHIPSAQVLEQGVMALHYDTFWDRRFSGRTQHGYDAGMVVGLLPGIELSGRMANYGRDGPPDPRTGFDPLVIRDLSANFKIQLPRLLRGQPDIALGATDVGGAASNFRSKYLVATQRFGPAQFTLGYGRGPDQFDGLFGGVQLGLFNTGLGLLAEHDGRDEFIGLRYASPPIDWLNGARLVGTLSRSLGAHNELGERQDRTEFSVVLRLPLGTPARPRAAAGAASAGIAAVPQVAAPANPVVQAAPVPSVSPQAKSSSKPPAPRADTAAATAVATAAAPPADLALIVDLAKRLEAGGLDHVRVGITGESRSVLVARFDPSLYARNDMDAVGVALGVMAQGSVGRYVT